MNRLLPNLEDLFPIIDERKTFSETPFNKDFEKLSFISKLQIVNDIIRQTMMYNPIPNPKTHDTYQFDSSPFVGYKCGKVENISNNKFYGEYIEIKGSLFEIYEK